MIKKLRKIQEVLDWHPDFDIEKIIKQVKIRRNFTYTLLFLLLCVSFAFNVAMYYKNHKIDELRKNVFSLENNLWVNNDIKDSLMNTIESSGYLEYLIESESRINLPLNVNKEHLKYMFERAIDKKIPVAIMFRLIQKESRFDSAAISPTNAMGYMQVVPSTYKLYCKKLDIEPQPITAKKNIYVGTWYLSDMYEYWHKRLPKTKPEIIWDYALATYNIGVANMNDTTFQRIDVLSYVNYINQ